LVEHNNTQGEYSSLQAVASIYLDEFIKTNRTKIVQVSLALLKQFFAKRMGG
jgi:hypothetical protein